MKESEMNNILTKLHTKFDKIHGLPAKAYFILNESQKLKQIAIEINKSLDSEKTDINLLQDIGNKLGYPLTQKRRKDIEAYNIKIIKHIAVKTLFLEEAKKKLGELTKRLDKINELGSRVGFNPLPYKSSEAQIQTYLRKMENQVEKSEAYVDKLLEKYNKEKEEEPSNILNNSV